MNQGRGAGEPLDDGSGVRSGRHLVWSLFTTIAGADSALLFGSKWRSPFYNRWDVPYFVGLGSAVVVTGILAVFSSSIFAAYLFNGGANLFEYWPAGLLVGAAIVTFDRWLVSDLDVGIEYSRRRAIGSILGGVARELAKALPRLALTLVMAVLFAEPLLLALYKSDIESQLRFVHENQVASLSNDYLKQAQALNSQATVALKDLMSLRDAVDPALQESIKSQRALIQEEQKNGNGNPRGGTCGPVCDKMVAVLTGYEATLTNEKSAWDVANATDVTRLKERISSTSQISNLSVTQVDILGAIACPTPLSPAPSYPKELPAGLSISIVCPSSEANLTQRKVALEQLQDSTQAYTVANSNLTPAQSASSVAGVTQDVWLVRLLLILLDALPVAVKTIRGLSPKYGYYLAVAARQAEVDASMGAIREAAMLDLKASTEAAEQASIIEREMRTMEYERMLKTVHESRVRLGLRRIEDFVQDILRRHRKAQTMHGTDGPPPFEKGDLVPPPNSNTPSAASPDPRLPANEVKHPRGLDDY